MAGEQVRAHDDPVGIACSTRENGRTVPVVQAGARYAGHGAIPDGAFADRASTLAICKPVASGPSAACCILRKGDDLHAFDT